MENTSPTSLQHWPPASWVCQLPPHSVPASVQFPAQQYYASHCAASAQSHLAADHSNYTQRHIFPSHCSGKHHARAHRDREILFFCRFKEEIAIVIKKMVMELHATGGG
ncbi:hypothetical protein TcCL_NonESM03910 [Trypanosoma cruzi]|nr:hypothetical protein TcCL_NonESM03910 [Trypanosoma cruzi]